MPAPTQIVRAAIYTRKSTNEGLDSDWTTLDVQRQAAEAYILSQGWETIPDRYDDGGFSGGTLERPALKRLLADIDAGRVDCVVVHKIDRLSRSLLDFVRIAEAESQAATITSRLAELEREIASHKGMTVDLEHLRATLAEFDGIWDVLLPHEKAQLIRSLIQRVVCSPGGEIQVVFRT